MSGVHEPGEEYVGAAELISEDSEVLAVEVHLRGHVEPIDGRFHWYGRIAADDAVTTRHRPGTNVAVRTPHGTRGAASGSPGSALLRSSGSGTDAPTRRHAAEFAVH